MEGDTISSCPFNQALIVRGAPQMSGLGGVIPSNCCSMTVGRWVRVCTGVCVRERPREGKVVYIYVWVSVCLTRGCIRGAGTESLERRGRAGVTNQLWESRREKTRPLFSPKREREGTDKTNLFGPNPPQMNGYLQKYQGWWGIGGQRSSTYCLTLFFSFFLFFPLFHPSSNE